MVLSPARSDTLRAMAHAGVRSAVLRAFGAALLGLALGAPTLAHGRAAANPQINVYYSLSGAITVTLADGTPVGTTSGSPTVIPGGYYRFLMIGPGGCASIPQFILKGPGTYLSDNLDGGETQSLEHLIHLNNKWALDGRDPSSYGGIQWCFGKFDRPWFDKPVFGVIRPMSLARAREKFDAETYIRMFPR